MAKGSREHPPRHRKETEEEREAREAKAIAEFQERQRQEATQKATDAEAVPTSPDTVVGAAFENFRKKNPDWKPAPTATEPNAESEKREEPTTPAGDAPAPEQSAAGESTEKPVPEDLPPEFQKIFSAKDLSGIQWRFREMKDSEERQAYLNALREEAVKMEERRIRREQRVQEKPEKRKKHKTAPKAPASVDETEKLHIDTKNLDIDLSKIAPEGAAKLDLNLSEPTPKVPRETKKIEKEEQAAIDKRIAAAKRQEELYKRYKQKQEEVAGTAKTPIEEPKAATVKTAAQRQEELYTLYTQKHREMSPGEVSEAEKSEVLRNIGEKLNAEKEEKAVEADAVRPEDVPEYIKERLAEGTRKELVGRLKGVITSAKGKLYETGAAAKEKIGWWKSSEEHLIRRSAELDAEAAKMGIVETWFRKSGEWYNKRHWTLKLAVGIGLGIGYGAALSAVSYPAIIGCIAAIGAQRALGLSTMFLKYEKDKSLQESSWLKGRALMNAIGYTALMTGGMTYLAKEISDHDLINRTKEWLGNMRGYHAAQVPVQEAAQPTPAAAAPAAGEAPYVPSEMPPLTVHAAPGQGYEYMLQQMSAKLHEAGLKAESFFKPGLPPEQQSDIYKLLSADKTNIGAVAHQLASDPSHAFYHAGGANVIVRPDDILAFNTQGQVMLMEEGGAASVHALHPELVTPPIHAEAPVAPLAGETIPAHEAIPTVDLTHGQAEAAAFKEAHGVPMEQAPAPVETAHPSAAEPEHIILRDSSGNPVTDSSGNPVYSQYPEHAPAAEAPAPVPHEAVPTPPAEQLSQALVEHTKEFINAHNVPIDPLHGHVFQDSSGAALAYGNDFNARLDAAQEFAKANPDTSVWLQAEKPVFYEGAWRPWVIEVRSSTGWFGLGRSVQILSPDGPPDPSHIGAINPENFIKQLDK